MTRSKLLCSLACNLFVLVSVVVCVGAFFVRGGKGNMDETAKRAFMYFTVDSNILCAAACLGLIIFDVHALLRGGDALPRWLDLFKLMGASAVGLTFLTVILYLLPVSHFDFKLMYAGRNLFLHALCPLAAMLSWAFLEQSGAIAFPWTLLALIPTALYGALYGWMVLVRKLWSDFYSFNIGGKWYLSYAVMLTLSLLIAEGLRALRR
ncbi:MAG: hypothetical protein IKH07_04260 [Oscillospiraceae bacterium]|nr:hypothetical protein [Oscillospiraceae bacterium]